MKRIFPFKQETDIDRDLLISVLKEAGVEGEMKFLTPREGYLVSDDAYTGKLMGALNSYKGGKIAFVSVKENSPEATRMLEEALGYFPNRVSYLSEIYLKQMSFGDYSCLKKIAPPFKGLDEETLKAAEAYLSAGRNANKASEAVFLHRNTFRYRMKRFKQVTGLDLSDYHDALLFEIYLRFIKR